MSCTCKQIKASCDKPPPVKKVETPEWGGDGFVFVRGLMAPEAEELQKLLPAEGEPGRELASIVAWTVMCACNEKGERLFAKEDMEWLCSDKSLLAPLQRCTNEAVDLNGHRQELAKNLAKDQSGDSPST